MVDRRMTDKEARNAQTSHLGGGFFEIHVRGHLGSQWSEWLGGLQGSLLDNGEMILTGHLPDQAALMGLLNKLYGLNLTLLSVSEVGQKIDVNKATNQRSSVHQQNALQRRRP